MGLFTPEVGAVDNRAKPGFIATVCPDGTPSLFSKGTTMAWETGHLVFADFYSSGIIHNLLIDPSVEINVKDVFTRKGYRFKGAAEVLRPIELFSSVLAHHQKAGSRYKTNPIVTVKVNRGIPVLSPAHDHLTEGEIPTGG